VNYLFMEYRNRLVTFGFDFREKSQLLVWHMWHDERQFTLIHQELLERLRGKIRYMYNEMDDQYVAIWVQNDLKISIAIYFFSLNTMKIEGSLKDIPLRDSYVYRSGLLFNLRSGYIR
jgi:hypothetical protein